MMMSRVAPTLEARRAMLPPGFYLLAASRMLAVARRLYNVGLLPPSCLRAALMWSGYLSRAGMRSWRQRRARRRP
jgi:hypothetical protein